MEGINYEELVDMNVFVDEWEPLELDMAKFDFSRIITVSGYGKVHSIIFVDRDDKSIIHFCLP